MKSNIITLREQQQKSEQDDLFRKQKLKQQLIINSYLENTRQSVIESWILKFDKLISLDLRINQSEPGDNQSLNKVIRNLYFLINLQDLSIKISQKQNRSEFSQVLLVLGESLLRLKQLTSFSFYCDTQAEIVFAGMYLFCNGISQLENLTKIDCLIVFPKFQETVLNYIVALLNGLNKNINLKIIKLKFISNSAVDQSPTLGDINLSNLKQLEQFQLQLFQEQFQNKGAVLAFSNCFSRLLHLKFLEIALYQESSKIQLSELINDALQVENLEKLKLIFPLSYYDSQTIVLGNKVANPSKLTSFQLYLICPNNNQFIKKVQLQIGSQLNKIRNLNELEIYFQNVDILDMKALGSWILENEQLYNLKLNFILQEVKRDSEYLYPHFFLMKMNFLKVFHLRLLITEKNEQKNIGMIEGFEGVKNLEELNLNIDPQFSLFSKDSFLKNIDLFKNIKVLTLSSIDKNDDFKCLELSLQYLQNLVELNISVLISDLFDYTYFEKAMKNLKYQTNLKKFKMHIMKIQSSNELPIRTYDCIFDEIKNLLSVYTFDVKLDQVILVRNLDYYLQGITSSLKYLPNLQFLRIYNLQNNIRLKQKLKRQVKKLVIF